MLIGFLGYFDGPIPYIPKLDEIYVDNRSEFIGIGFGVLIIANAGEFISRQQEKGRLILQMGSPDNAFAIEAARQLSSKGWLYDGSLRGAVLTGADLNGAKLFEANLTGADLRRANLGGANLCEANLSEATLFEANLCEADLYRAKLNGAKLFEANLTGADLYRATLRGANLCEANLKGADLSETKYNNETIWPDDFDPVAAQAILLEPEDIPKFPR